MCKTFADDRWNKFLSMLPRTVIVATMRDGGIHAEGFDIGAQVHRHLGDDRFGVLAVFVVGAVHAHRDGGHQEGGLRAGTYNNQAIIGLGKAAELAKEGLEEERSKLWAMRTALKQGIEKSIDNVVFNGSDDYDTALPGTLDVSFVSAEGESILLYLDLEGIEVSTGSACASGSLEPSYVLLASGLDVELAHGSIRFSFGRYNSMDDVDYVLQKLPPIIDKIRSMSTRKV